VQLLGEQQVGLLAVPIDLRAVVGVGVEQLLGCGAGEQLPRSGLTAGHHGHTQAAGIQQRPETGDDGRVTEMIGPHLPLEALRRQQRRAAHDPGVADQAGEVVVRAEQRHGAVPDLVEVSQVELDDAGRARSRHAGCRLRTPPRVAHRKHHVGATVHEMPGGRESETAVGAGDDVGRDGSRHSEITTLPRAWPSPT
jgi:hypothetical protein